MNSMRQEESKKDGEEEDASVTENGYKNFAFDSSPKKTQSKHDQTSDEMGANEKPLSRSSAEKPPAAV